MSRGFERGTSAVEMALWLPVLFSFLLMALALGIMLIRGEILSDRVNVACRYLSMRTPTAPTDDSARCLVVYGASPDACAVAPTGMPGLTLEDVQIVRGAPAPAIPLTGLTVITVSVPIPMSDVLYDLPFLSPIEVSSTYLSGSAS